MMRPTFLFALTPLVFLVPGNANADPNLPSPVVSVRCLPTMSSVTIATVPNTNYVFHFKKLPPVPQVMNVSRYTTGVLTSFTGLPAGNWTVYYKVPGKGSPSTGFTVPRCKPRPHS
jgi:hypothetical protein